MTTLQWDVEHLRDRARDRRETELEKQREADWQEAGYSTERMLSETRRGTTCCPSRKCRRARRCLWQAPICAPLLLFRVSADRKRRITEHFYTEIQLRRRAAVLGEDAKA
ncbi:hypothetical protein ONR75_11415 [Rhodopseudomonas sp. P2A-2r]|uniref:hypothetical protein n=1 Tax=Rhodopseudomonas sp. P2A-2r TaxID=2991972 RepID=UPI0022344D1D|nr:hypothetical protein [Rhodopseudomonas sp. P2A-2r]UZE51164.1 hypothetical protein ONR75_11415 [Rhodopseudomonas sp. P2A-2r]